VPSDAAQAGERFSWVGVCFPGSLWHFQSQAPLAAAINAKPEEAIIPSEPIWHSQN